MGAIISLDRALGISKEPKASFKKRIVTLQDRNGLNLQEVLVGSTSMKKRRKDLKEQSLTNMLGGIVDAS